MNSRFLVLSSICAAMVGCSGGSSDSPTTTVTPNVINTALSTLKDVTPEFTAASTMSLRDGFQVMANLGASTLTTNNSFPNIDNPGSITSTGLTFLGDLFGEDAQNSVFWRARTPFLIACTIDALATRGNALYATSQTSLTLSSDLIGKCGTAAEFTGPGNVSLIGQSVTFTITDLADTTNYDQIIVMPGSSNPMFGGNDQWIYVRNNDTTLNFMHIEINDDSGNEQFGVSSLHFEKATKSGHFQYVSKQTGGGTFAYRILMDSAQDMARVFTFWKMTTGQAHTIIANVGSGYTAQTSAALSLSFTGLTGVGTSGSLDNGNACLNLVSTPPEITTDGDAGLTCNSQTISAVGAVASHAIDTSATALSWSGIKAWAEDPAQGAAKYPNFTASTIQSATLGL